MWENTGEPKTKAFTDLCMFFFLPPPQKKKKKIRNYWNGFQEMVSKKLFIEQNFTENFGARIFGKPICL